MAPKNHMTAFVGTALAVASALFLVVFSLVLRDIAGPDSSPGRSAPEFATGPGRSLQLPPQIPADEPARTPGATDGPNGVPTPGGDALVAALGPFEAALDPPATVFVSGPAAPEPQGLGAGDPGDPEPGDPDSRPNEPNRPGDGDERDDPDPPVDGGLPGDIDTGLSLPMVASSLATDSMTLGVAGRYGTATLAIQSQGPDNELDCALEEEGSFVNFPVLVSDPSVAEVRPQVARFSSCEATPMLRVIPLAPGTAEVSLGEPVGEFERTFEPEEATFVVHVTEEASSNRRPVVTVPEDQLVNTADHSGATVDFSATASDVEDGVLEPLCAPNSGSFFPIGASTVKCSVTDSGGAIASESFTVTANVPPTLDLPEDIVVDQNIAGGATAAFEVGASDVNEVVAPTCDHSSGELFPFGATVVSCEVTDASGASASGAFTVTVDNLAPSAPGAPRVTVPPTPDNPGLFTLAWEPAADFDALTYELQHKLVEGGEWATVAAGLGGPSFEFAAPEATGVWVYRARASDGLAASEFSAASDPVTVTEPPAEAVSGAEAKAAAAGAEAEVEPESETTIVPASATEPAAPAEPLPGDDDPVSADPEDNATAARGTPGEAEEAPDEDDDLDPDSPATAEPSDTDPADAETDNPEAEDPEAD